MLFNIILVNFLDRIADLTGTGVQDTAIATHVFERLQNDTTGTVISA